MNMADISVIVPVYGVEPYLRECLDSIVNQTCKSLQIILIDDGSPDNCPGIIDEYAQIDERIVVVHKNNEGVSAARNDGIALANGTYVFFCDSDDWLPASALENMLKEALEYDADVVIGDYTEKSANGDREVVMFSNSFRTDKSESIEAIQKAIFNKGRANYKTADFDHAHGLGAPWHHLIKKSLIDEHDLKFDLNVKGLFDDGLFMLNVFEYAERVAYISVSTYYYRIVDTSITHGFKSDIMQRYSNVFSALEKFMSDTDKDEDFRKAYYVRVYAYLNKSMDVYFLNANNKKSKKERYNEFRETLKSDPYKTALKKMDVSALGYKRSKLLVRLLQYGFLRAYWMIKSH